MAVELNARAASIHERAVLLSDGRSLAAQSVISTIGTRPNSLANELGLATERGRIVVEADLSVPDHAGVWALGDCARVPNAHDGQLSPPTAQFAVRQAKALAGNLLAHRQGEPTRPFAARPLGMMAAIGRHNGVAEVLGDRLQRAARVAAVARLLPVADAHVAAQAAHLGRMDLGHVLSGRHHAPAFHAQRRPACTRTGHGV